MPEQEVAQALHAYTRSELLSAAASLDGEDCRYLAGVGLLSTVCIEKVRSALEAALAGQGGRLTLEDAAWVAAEALGGKVDVEALIKLYPDWRTERPSLFEAYLVCSSD